MRPDHAIAVELSLNLIYSYMKFDAEMAPKKTTLISVIRDLLATGNSLVFAERLRPEVRSKTTNGARFIIREGQ